MTLAWTLMLTTRQGAVEMGTYRAEFTRTIDQPIEVVWEFLTTDDTWREPFIKNVRPLDGDDMGVGSRYENRAQAGPISFRLVNEIIRLDPPRHLAWKDITPKTTPIRTIEGSYNLEPVNGGTRFTLSLHSETTGVPATLAKLLTRTVIAPKLLRQLEEGVHQAADS